MIKSGFLVQFRNFFDCGKLRDGLSGIMFFEFSKILWALIDPPNLFLIVLAIAVLMLGTRWQKGARRVLVLLTLMGVGVATIPLANWGFWVLENRFPEMTTLPEQVDGIIVAGGIVDPKRSHDRGQPVISGAVERLTAMVRLARHYPQAKVIFSGGSGDLLQPDFKEAHYIAPFIKEMGLDPSRIIFEDNARNTAENAQITMKMLQPKETQTWLLVTSAFHMPRAMGSFRKAGWRIQAYPVDYGTSPNFKWQFFFNFSEGLMRMSGLAHEITGLIVYRITGRSQSVFPKP